MSTVLNELIEISKKQNNQNEKDIFETNSIPNITLYDYIIRIISYSNCEENTLISALIYIDGLHKKKKLQI